MIEGEPRIVERAGERCVVDANGDLIVCRRRTPHRACVYHCLDIEAFAEGEIRPACRAHGQRADATWDYSRRGDLDAIWRGCLFAPCFGDGSSEERPSRSASGREYKTLAGLLRSISADEYDRAGVDLAQFEIDDEASDEGDGS